MSSLPSLFYKMSPHRDIYMYEILRNNYTVPTRCGHRGGMVDPLVARPVGPSASRLAIKSIT
jgi:hypothetical protein